MPPRADGPGHDWPGGRGPGLTLAGGSADATVVVTGGVSRAAEDAAGRFETPAQTVRRHGLPLALHTDLSGVFVKDPNRPPQPDPGGPRARHAGDPPDRCPQPGGEGPGRAAVGDPPGPLRARAAAWSRDDDRGRQRAPRPVPAPPQRAVRRPGREPRARLAALARRPPARGGPVLRARPQGRPGRDGRLGRRGLALPRRRGGGSWAGRATIARERLDGSPWARDGQGPCRLTDAPPTAPVLRARKGDRVPELAPPPGPREPVADPAPSAATAAPLRRRDPMGHPWRRHPAVRPEPR